MIILHFQQLSLLCLYVLQPNNRILGCEIPPKAYYYEFIRTVSDHVESFLALSNSQHQLVDQNLFGLIVRQVQLIETSMGTREPLLLELAMDVEFLYSIHTSQVLEPFDRDSRAPSHELQEGCSKFHVKGLQDLKQPNNNLVVLDIVDKVGVILEVVDIDGGAA